MKMLFRVWNPDSKTMYYMDKDNMHLLIGKDGGGIAEIDLDLINEQYVVTAKGNKSYTRFEPENLMQYIGTNDFEDRHIYNGDIVLTPYGHIRKIICIEGTYMAVRPDGTKPTPVHFWKLQAKSLPLVIGNIYENPEMLIEGYKYEYRERPCLKCEDGKYIKYRNRATNETKFVCDKCGDTVAELDEHR
jgi:hypothetical protein